ncbi:JAB domain-containing protein, partial [Carnobacterium maltaromaticum]
RYKMKTVKEIEGKKSVQLIKEVVRVKQTVVERPVEYNTMITSTTIAKQIGIDEIGDEAQEVLLLVALNTKNKINAIHKVFSGSLDSSIAHPREIFRSALLNNAARILIYHNHPSGNTDPSIEDYELTDRFFAAGELLGIEVLDHIIVAGNDAISFRENTL